MASRQSPHANPGATAKLYESDGRFGDVPRATTPGDGDFALERFDPFQSCLFCNRQPCACGPVHFSAWGVLVEIPGDNIKGWIVNPDTCTISINERASREAYQWHSKTAPESYVVFLRHKFRRENPIIKIKPLY